MSNEDQVYRDLQQYMSAAIGSFESEEVLKLLLTPEEAGIATLVPAVRAEPAKTIHKRLEKIGMSMSLKELEQKLDHMAYKGALIVKREGLKERHYRIPGPGGGGVLWEFQVNRISKELLELQDKHRQERMSKVFADRPKVAGLRTIPVDKSVPLPEKYMIGKYDDIRSLIENSPGPFSVANCICRQGKDLRGQPCKHSDFRETCLQIGPDHAMNYIEMGIGRAINREEVYQLLDKCEEAGFILMPENSQKPENICICCGDCCAPLSAAKKTPRPADRYMTNFYAEVDPALCTGCGICVERCQLEARVLIEDKAFVIRDRCIGCGNCVTRCSENATRLRKKEDELVPPKDREATVVEMLTARLSRWNSFKLRLKMLLGQSV